MGDIVDRSQLLAELRRVRAAYVQELLSTPPETAYRRPAEWEWCIGEIAAHVVENGQHVRSRVIMMRDELDPLIGRMPDDPNRLAAVAEHGHDPLERLAAEVERVWDDIERICLDLDETQWRRECRHRLFGSVTVGSYLARSPAHFVEHTEEIAELKGR
jgi:hypothetical protein